MTYNAAQDDIAYLKSLVEGDGGAAGARTFGQIYTAGGIAYGLQTLGHWAQGIGYLNLAPLAALALATVPSLVFFAILTAILWRSRKDSRGGPASKAVQTVFMATGVANGVLAIAIATVALRNESMTIWLIYPIVVCVLQGAAWLVSNRWYQHAWHGVVAAAWFALAIALGFAPDILTFSLLLGMGLIVCMGGPGLVLARAR